MSIGGRGAFRGARIALLFGSTVLTSPFFVPEAAAQNLSYSIPAGNLGPALTVWARESGVKLLAPSAALGGRSTHGLSGTFEPQQALSALLAGTGLTYNFDGSTVTIIDPAVSGSAPVLDEGAVLLETIDVTGAKAWVAAENAPYETPGSSAFISSETIERVPPSRPGDIFNSTPGVIAGSKNTGSSVDVNIRGLQGAGRVKVMVDGTQQSSVTYRGYAGNDNRSYFDPDLIGGVEIQKGPSAGPYGSGSMGGIVNVRTLTADDILLDDKSYGARVRGSLASNSIAPSLNPFTSRPESEEPDFLTPEAGLVSVAGAAVGEHVEVVSAFVRRRHGNYFSGKHGAQTYQNGLGNEFVPFETLRYSPNLPGEEVTNTSEDSTSYLIKTLLHGEDHSLELAYLRTELETGYAYPTWLVVNQPMEQYFLSDIESDRYSAKYTWNPDSDLIDLHVNTWMTDLASLDPIMRNVGQYQNKLDSSAWGFEVWNKSSFEAPFGGLTLSYGGEYSSSDMYVTQKVSAVAPEYFKEEGQRDISGVFLTSKFDLTDWLTLDAGIRYDSYEIEALNRRMTTTASPSGDGVVPNFGITISPFEGVQVFGTYAEGYRPPTIREISGTRGDTGFVYPNPDLRPERSENWEVGLNVLRNGVLKDGDKLRVKTAYFDNFYRDYITAGRITTSSCGNTICYQNFSEAVFKGVEFSGNYDAGRYFVETAVNYYTEVRIGEYDSLSTPALTYEQGMNYVPPELTVQLTLGLRLLEEKLTLGARGNYVGHRASPYLYSGTYPTTRYHEDVLVADLFGSYDINEHVKLEASVENVTDRYYIDTLAVSRLPSPGRTFRAGFTARF